MKKIAKIMLFFVLTSCSTQDLALQEWNYCAECGNKWDNCTSRTEHNEN